MRSLVKAGIGLLASMSLLVGAATIPLVADDRRPEQEVNESGSALPPPAGFDPRFIAPNAGAAGAIVKEEQPGEGAAEGAGTEVEIVPGASGKKPGAGTDSKTDGVQFPAKPGTWNLDSPGSSVLRSRPILASSTQRRRLTAALSALERGEIGTALRDLQTLREQADDAFLGDDDVVSRYPTESVQSRLGDLFRDLPAAVREPYQQLYGPIAQRELNLAEASRSPEDLAEIVRRYAPTIAGAEAGYRLANWLFDRGRWFSAAGLLEELRLHPDAKKYEPFLSRRIAIARYRHGDIERAKEAVQRLARFTVPRSSGPHLTWPKPDEDPVAWLEKSAGVATSASSPSGLSNRVWSNPGASVSRNPVVPFGVPFLSLGWRQDLNQLAEIPGWSAIQRDLLRSIQASRSSSPERASVTYVPAPQAVVANNVAVVRGLGRLHAFDTSTGRRLWDSAEFDQAFLRAMGVREFMVNRPLKDRQIGQLITNRLWADLTYGTLSTDGERVFAIAGSAFLAQMPDSNFNAGLGALPNIITPETEPTNRIAAFDLRTGKQLWEKGAATGIPTDPLAGVFFLGSPVVQDGMAYLLGETGGEIRLFVLDSATGALDWAQTIAKVDLTLRSDPFRKTDGLSPTIVDEVLLCPTETGVVVAVDIVRRRLMWASSYGSDNDSRPIDPQRKMMQMLVNRNRARAAFQENGQHPGRWLDAGIVTSGERAILATRDSDRLLCFDIRSGELIWSRDCNDALYVAGIFDDLVVAVAYNNIMAYRLSDGSFGWSMPAIIDNPSGRGLATQGLFLQPTSTGDLVTVRLNDGVVVSITPVDDHQPLGNLACSAAGFVSVEPLGLRGFPRADALEEEMNRTLAENPTQPSALALRGELELLRGRFKNALDDFQKSLAGNPSQARVRKRLVDSVLQGLSDDFKTFSQYATLAEPMIVDAEQRTAFALALAAGYEREGQPNAAFDAYLGLTHSQAAISGFEQTGAVRLRHDRLVRSRLKSLWDASSESDRRTHVENVRARYAAAAARADLETNRRLLNMLPEIEPPVSALQLELERRSAADQPIASAEQILKRIQQSGDLEFAGPATLRLARMYVAAQRPDLAFPLVEQLRKRFADVDCLEDKTGLQCAEAFESQPAMKSYRSQSASWPTGRVLAKYKRMSGHVREAMNLGVNIPMQGATDVWNGIRLQVDQLGMEYTAIRGDGKPLWEFDLYPKDDTDDPAAFGRNTMVTAAGVKARSLNHLVVLDVGANFLVVDALDNRQGDGAVKLWGESLLNPRSASRIPMLAVMWQLLPGGGQKIDLRDLSQNSLGSIALVTDDEIVVHRGARLSSYETYTGKLLWSRDDLAGPATACGDARAIAIVSRDSEFAELYSTVDGRSLGKRKIPFVSGRMGTVGASIASWEQADAGSRLRITDIISGTEHVHEFPRGAVAILNDRDEVVVLHGDGGASYVSVKTGEKTSSATGTFKDGTLAPEMSRVFFLPGEEVDIVATASLGSVVPHDIAVPQAGLTIQPMLATGRLFGIRRSDATIIWSRDVEQMHLDLRHPATTPMIVMTSQSFRGGPPPRHLKRLLCLDRRTGRVIYRINNWQQFSSNWVARVDAESKHVDVDFPEATLSLTYTDQAIPENDPAIDGDADSAEDDRSDRSDEPRSSRVLPQENPDMDEAADDAELDADDLDEIDSPAPPTRRPAGGKEPAAPGKEP